MATLLDVDFVSFLSPIFIFLFLFAVFYALLKKFKIFGEKTENLSAIASLSISLLVLFSTPARTIVSAITPAFAVVFVMIFLIFLMYLFLGVKEETMIEFTKQSTFITITTILFIVIFLIALTNAFGPILLTNMEAGFWNSTKRVIFSPKILGALFLLAVTAYTVRYLGSSK